MIRDWEPAHVEHEAMVLLGSFDNECNARVFLKKRLTCNSLKDKDGYIL